jgi:S-adenosylmethionine:tRNA ribosyltransferase-isomerase
MAATSVIADFTLPAHLEAGEPPEARGLRRDDVRLLVSRVSVDSLEHARFSDLPRWLAAGDVLVVNTSATLNAAIMVEGDHGTSLELHLSTQLPGGFWTIELRKRNDAASASVPYYQARAGMTLALPAGGRATLLAPYPFVEAMDSRSRLWIAALQTSQPLTAYLDGYGFPIRYGYVDRAWPLAMYQTVFALEPGSAEMPSAGRPFTPELVTALVSRGIEIAPIVLHAGVASLEDHEPPYEEFYRVTRPTAERVNSARRAGHRIIAVGTTVVRALETVTDEQGLSSPGEGWTRLIVTPDRPIRSVDGLITGFHEPRATHLALLEAVTSAVIRTRSYPRDGRSASLHLSRAYEAARDAGYLWHEFGDSHLILP